MPRGKQGTKTGRADRNRLFQATLRERKRLRRQRRHDQGDVTLREYTEGVRTGSYLGRMVSSGVIPADGEVVAHQGEQIVPPRPTTDEEIAALPVLDELDTEAIAELGNTPHAHAWSELEAEAKRRKRGIRRIAESHGWTFTGQTKADEKIPTNYTREA